MLLNRDQTYTHLFFRVDHRSRSQSQQEREALVLISTNEYVCLPHEDQSALLGAAGELAVATQQQQWRGTKGGLTGDVCRENRFSSREQVV